MVRLMKKGGRYLKGAALGKLGFCTSWAVSSHDDGPEWVQVVDVTLRLKNLPALFKGKRIVQASDLHCSRTVSGGYLKACIERINRLEADIVVLTGDYITHDYYGRFRKKVVKLLSGIRSKYGVLACLGNHDYGLNGNDELLAGQIVIELQDSGVNVLRNKAIALSKGNERLWFVGLGDIWADDFAPSRAFENVRAGEPVITLSHNPETVNLLHSHRTDIVLSGHTHGVGLGVRKEDGKHKITIHNYFRGMYRVGGKKLYVNRGLGRHGKFLYNSRPEITVFNLC